MEPVTLAAAAVAVLSPFIGQIAGGGLARMGEAAADSATQRVAELYRTIRGRITGSPYEEAVLDGAEAQPENENRLSALRDVLTELITNDPDFAQSLATLLDQSTELRHIQAADSGAIAGNNLNQSGTYVAGRDLNIGNIT